MKKYRIRKSDLNLVVEAIRYIHAGRRERRLMKESCGGGPALELPEIHVDDIARNMDYGQPSSSSHEGRMTKGKLFRLAQMAQRLHDKLVDEDDLPEWVQDKVTTAEDRLQAAHDYITYKIWAMENMQ